MNPFGFVRVTVCSPEVVIGDPGANVDKIVELLAAVPGSDIILFPELCITGYTCGDLYAQSLLIEQAEKAVALLASQTRLTSRIVVVGAPVLVDDKLFNCGIVIADGRVKGIVPKQHLPNGGEFYEPRHFSAADGSEPKTVDYGNQLEVPFGVDLLFGSLKGMSNSWFKFCVEICEDLWMPIPPSSVAALHGATLALNLSASNETVGKVDYRRDLVKGQSGRCIMGYAYASAGPSESIADIIFGGHCLIAENGSLLAETLHVGDGKMTTGDRWATHDIDVERCRHDRQRQRSFGDSSRLFPRQYRTVECLINVSREPGKLIRQVPALPFVPTNPETLKARCEAILDIQSMALVQKMKSVKKQTGKDYPILNLGLSGGLDSTHTFGVALRALRTLGLPPTHLHCKTMPGFGTTEKTKGIANILGKSAGVHFEEIDIRPQCMQMFKDLKHNPFGIDLLEHVYLETGEPDLRSFENELRNLPADRRSDLVFENVQARVRTSILMNSGLVLGTGDMSEIALGWMTFNADHMSMYNVNCGVPKTLIRFLVEYMAKNFYDVGDPIRDAMLECAGLVISPELLPTTAEGDIAQSTEAMVGPYVLHDFILLHFVRYGFSPQKILYLIGQSPLAKQHTWNEIKDTLRTFINRFFKQRFKGEVVPNGPQVGTFSLSPRGAWRMPPEAAVDMWLRDLDKDEE